MSDDPTEAAAPEESEGSGEPTSRGESRRRTRRGALREVGGHSHGHGPVAIPASEARRVRTVLAALVVPLLLATVMVGPRGASVGHAISARGTDQIAVQTVRTAAQTDAMVRPAIVIKKSQGWDI